MQITARVPLTNGGEMYVDEGDLPLICKINWCWFRPRSNMIYACGWSDGKSVCAHRLILRPPPGLVADHINRDGLDNRRENLRNATRAQNAANTGPRYGRQFKGVVRERATFVAMIGCASEPGQSHSRRLGRFETPEEAARAYDRAAYEKWGEFAYLNFPRAC